MAIAPSGTVTFLFTDIEGSTRLWEQSPAAMGPALRRHDALLRAAIEDNDGYVFTTAGDAFCAAFRAAPDALAAALDAQLAFAKEPWEAPVQISARMALHSGAAELRDNDYFGQPLNRAARLLAAGHGGQVLLSLPTRNLLGEGLPAGVSLRDMGDRRLKDLIRPERIYQVVASGLAADFPPLRTLDARGHNLPIQLTSFVGRVPEMQEVKSLLGSSRLVTLTGSGGAGKTRLALQVAGDLVDNFAQGVWFVELAPLTDPRLVSQSVATVLGIKEQPGGAIIDTLKSEIRDRELLLILDNCEHVVGASASLCQAVLSTSAGVRILASSREALRVPGEVVYRVPSLATPNPAVPADFESLNRYAAVQLFVDRAVAARSSFRVDDTNASAVASICQRLDGIPLALELAAARVRSLSVLEVNQRLDHRFRLLTGGSRTALPRQQTLRSLIDWSYDLLNETERTLLGRVAVFAGGWDLDAATMVCSGDGVDEVTTLDLLTSLSDKSLVLTDEINGGTRYRLLETVREYGLGELRAKADEPARRGRHLAYFLAVAEESEPHLMEQDQEAWLGRLEMEHDNLRSALTWSSAAGGNVEAGLRLAGALWRFWFMRGYFAEGRGWLSGLLAAAPAGLQSATRAKAQNGAGGLAWQQGDYQVARALHEESLALWRELGDRAGIAMTLNNLANVVADQGDYRHARPLYEESLAIRRELGDRWGIASSLNNLGVLARDVGDYVAARALQEEGLAIRRELGDRLVIAASLSNLGIVAREQGDAPAARALHAECLALYRELGNRWGTAASLNNLGDVTYDQGDLLSARRLHEESFAIRRDLGDRQGIADSLNNLGDVAARQGDVPSARRLYTESLTIRREVGERWGIAVSLDSLAHVAVDEGEHVAARRLYAESLRIQRHIGDQRGIASSLEGLASAAPASLRLAACIWGGAERLREEIGAPLLPNDRARYDRHVAAARVAMGDDAVFGDAWHEGRAMLLDFLIELALDPTVRER